MSDPKITSLAAFRMINNSLKEAEHAERVWDRVEPLCAAAMVSGPNSDTLWHDAASALLQYMDNEWPVEKENKQRASMLAEYCAQIFITGIFGRDPRKAEKAMQIQTAFLEGCENARNFSQARMHYTHTIDRLQMAATQRPTHDSQLD